MIAEVYPIRRMPRRFSVFDYLVPENLKLAPGSFVIVPFRGKPLRAVVRKVKTHQMSARKLKSVEAVLDDRPLTEQELAFFEILSFNVCQSVSSVLHSSIPPRPKRNAAPAEIVKKNLLIQKNEVAGLTNIINDLKLRKKAFIASNDLKYSAALILSYLQSDKNARIMVLFPNVREVELSAPYFAGQKLSIITGQETPVQRYLAWKAFREKRNRIFLGTRVASLLPSGSVDAVFVVNSSHENHKQSDRNPRFSALDNAWLMHGLFKTRLYFTDCAPNSENLYNFKSENMLFPPHKTRAKFVDLKREKESSPHPLISYTASCAMESALNSGRRVFCLFNKKGVARGLRCPDCGKEFFCDACSIPLCVYETTVHCHRCQHTEPLPLSCPECGCTNLTEKGFGNRAILKALKKLYPEKSVSVIEKSKTDGLNADILLATQYYFDAIASPFEPDKRIGCVVDLNADLPLYKETFRSVENAIGNFEKLRGFAERCEAEFVVQTHLPHIFSAYEDNPVGFLENELHTRKEYGLSPFTRNVSIRHKAGALRATIITLQHLSDQIRRLAPGTAVTAPKQLGGKSNACEIILTVEPDSLDALLPFLAKLSDDFIIDTNAQM